MESTNTSTLPRAFKTHGELSLMELITIIDYLKNIIKTRQGQVNNVINKGVKDWEEYRYLLGKLHSYNEIV